MDPAPTSHVSSASRTRLARRAALLVGGMAGVYLMIAYFALPILWRMYALRHPALAAMPGITHTKDQHPGDPLNIALIGSENDLKAIMQAAGWYPADPLGWRSDLKIAAATVLDRPYEEAPVSNLYLWSRPEDLAFEQPVGNNPRERHHVRFWKAPEVDDAGRVLWVGAATFDVRVGLSHTTGQITHHIAADVDAERDHVAATLQATGKLRKSRYVPEFHASRSGRNGGGDPWHTDGRLFLGLIEL
ncbi:MAG: LssY C-terminal domain-containing protein [Pirellulaceae bacterium]